MNQNCTKSESLQGKISIFANVCWGGGISGFQSLHGPVEGGVPGPLGWEFPGLAPPGRGPSLCGSRASTCPDTSVSEGVGARIGGKGCLPRLQVYPVLCRTCLSGGKGRAVGCQVRVGKPWIWGWGGGSGVSSVSGSPGLYSSLRLGSKDERSGKDPSWV